MNSAAEIWERVLSILKQNMTETTISTWFSDIEPVALDENRFILSVPTEFKRDILISRYAEDIKRALYDLFSADLDVTTKEQLQYGQGLMELLKQPLAHPLSMPQQVITLCVACNKVMLDIPVERIKGFQESLLRFFDTQHPEIIQELDEKKVLTPELTQTILELAKEFKDRW